jgi:CDP-diacylglycerol--serine O-phosphatidyltransferase
MCIKRYIPNTITLLNLLCGTIAVIFAFKGWQLFSVYMILAAALFDFLDGFAARLLKAYSEIGKELDSLADLVSFGLAPSILLFYRTSSISPESYEGLAAPLTVLLIYSPLVIVLASALRLAIFNTDSRQTEGFIGVPTPANAILIASFIHFTVYYQGFDKILENIWVYPMISLILSYLLVSNIPMFSLKLKSLRFKENKTRIIFVLLSLMAVIPTAITGAKWSFWLLATFVFYILYNIVIFAFETIADRRIR